jgi:hypothetical protein
VSCRQPLGTSEHRACIGLAYINFTSCHCDSKSSNLTRFHNSLKVKPAVTNAKRKLPSWLSTSETQTAEEVPEKKPRASRDQDKDVKVIDSDVEEGGKNTNGADFVEPEQGGSCNPEHVESQANDDIGDEPASARSDLKRRSPDAKETGGKETKKAKLEKGSLATRPPHQSKLSATSQSEDNELDRDHVKRRSDREKLVQGGESSQRTLPLSREGKGKAGREENQALTDIHSGSKNGPEREFSKLLVRSLRNMNLSLSSFGIFCIEG